jgi:RHS repeat-associated protein
MTDASGNQIGNTVKYLPFGEARANITVPTEKLFTGQRLDATGLYYYNARYYDATFGRFISADTIVQSIFNPQCFNRYTYSMNNPLKYTDPSGHWPDRALEDLSYLTLLNWVSMAASGLAVSTFWAVWDVNGNLDTHNNFPEPNFNPWMSEPGNDPGESKANIKKVAKIIIVTIVCFVAGGAFGSLLQKGDENGIPELLLNNGSSSPSNSQTVTFFDGSSGYFTAEQVRIMQQMGVL